ncbi:30S ribosomal protein S20 [bacterium]|nr:MAG: 30S ribosomal protein S20 [bacterium]
MPIIKSAMKRVRQEEKRRARNNATKRRIKASTKSTLSHVSTADVVSAQTELTKTISLLDKAVKKGTLHKNTASRRKSKLTRSYNAVAQEAYGTTAKTKKTTAKKPTVKKASSTAKKPAPKK